MNKLKLLLNTTAVKLSLKYSLSYVIILGITFIVLYLFITQFVDDQIKVNLIKESVKVDSVFNKGGIRALRNYILSHEQFKGEDHIYYILVNKNGNVVAGDLNKWPSRVKFGKPVRNIWISSSDIIGKVPDGDGYWPAIAMRLGNGVKILIAQGIKGTEDLRETLFTIMAILYGLIVIMTMTIGLLLGKNMLWYTNNIKKSFEKITRGDLSKRIPISLRNDEFDKISMYINDMLNEIEKFITQSKEAANSLAHDLKTPLSRLRYKLELLLLNNKQNKQCGFLEVEKMIDELDKLLKMINSILELTQIETGALRRNWNNVNISKIVFDAVDFYQPFAEEKEIEITFIKDSDIFILGNEQLLSQAIINILDNAVKFIQKGGKITVSCGINRECAVISICDNGPGVKPEYYTTITKKFVKLDVSRSLGGNGLGLSLVKAITDIHKGQLNFKDNNPGLCVVLKFNIG